MPVTLISIMSNGMLGRVIWYLEALVFGSWKQFKWGREETKNFLMTLRVYGQ